MKMMHHLRTSSSLDLPELPLTDKLPNLFDGVLLCIKGQVWPNAKKVTIQLRGSSEDVALSLELIFDGQDLLVARSCLKNGRLKKKEIDVFESNPKKGQVFEIIVLVTLSVFKCSINGMHVFDFPIFFKLDFITEFKISGHCDIARISFQMPKPASSPPRPPRSAPEPPCHVQLPMFFPPVMMGHPMSPPPIGFMSSYSPVSTHSSPHSLSSGDFGVATKLLFSGGIPSERVIILYATAKPSSSWFKVSFKTSETSYDSAFVVYVNMANGEVVRSDVTSGIVGDKETSVPYFPFKPGDPFSILFLCLPNVIKMAVNQSHFLEFKLRGLRLEDVHCVQVEGEIHVSHLYDTPVGP